MERNKKKKRLKIKDKKCKEIKIKGKMKKLAKECYKHHASIMSISIIRILNIYISTTQLYTLRKENSHGCT